MHGNAAAKLAEARAQEVVRDVVSQATLVIETERATASTAIAKTQAETQHAADAMQQMRTEAEQFRIAATHEHNVQITQLQHELEC